MGKGATVGISAARAAAVAAGVILGAVLFTTYHVLLPPAAQTAAQAWQALQHSVEGQADRLVLAAAVAAVLAAVVAAMTIRVKVRFWGWRPELYVLPGGMPTWSWLVLKTGVFAALTAAPAAYLAYPYMGDAVTAALGWASSSLASASASVASAASSPYVSPAAAQVAYAVASLLGWLSWVLGSLVGLGPLAGYLLAVPAAAALYIYHARTARPRVVTKLEFRRRMVEYKGPPDWVRQLEEERARWREEVAKWERRVKEYEAYYNPERCAKEILAEAARVIAETCECGEGGTECYGTGEASGLGYICRAARAFAEGPVQGYEVVYDGPDHPSVRHRVRVEVDRAGARVRFHIERFVDYGREKDWDETFECRAGDISCIRGVLALFVKGEHEVYGRVVVAKWLKSGCLEPPPPPPPPSITAKDLANMVELKQVVEAQDSYRITGWGLPVALPAEDVFQRLINLEHVRAVIRRYNIGRELAEALLREAEAGGVKLPQGLKVYPDGTVEHADEVDRTIIKTLETSPMSASERAKALLGFIASAAAIAGVFAAPAPPHIAVPAVVGAAAGALALAYNLAFHPRSYPVICEWAERVSYYRSTYYRSTRLSYYQSALCCGEDNKGGGLVSEYLVAPQDPEVDAGRGTFADEENVRLFRECGKWCYWRVFRIEYTRWQERAGRWGRLLYVLAAAPTAYLYILPLLPGDVAVWASAATTGLGLAAAAVAGYPLAYFGSYWAHRALKYLRHVKVMPLVVEETVKTLARPREASRLLKKRWKRMWSTAPRVLGEGKDRAVPRKILSHLLGLLG